MSIDNRQKIAIFAFCSPMGYYSHSQIATYTTCPRKYKYDKIDGLGKETKESSLILILGTAVHAALEFLYKQRTNLKTPLYEQVLQIYLMTFTKEMQESTTTFTPEDTETFIQRGKVYLERYRTTYTPFDQAITMAVEQSISIKFENNISFSGYIDRLDVDGDTITIVDYKTSKKVEPDDHDVHMQQLTLYALGIQQQYGKKFSTIQAKLIYLHLEKELCRTIDPTALSTVKERYFQHADEIERVKERFEKTQDEELFPAILWSHCTYCPFQIICPKRMHNTMDDDLVMTDLGEQSIKRMVDDYAVLQKKISILTKEKETLARALVDYAEAKNLEALYGNEWKTGVHARTFRGVQKEKEEQFKALLAEKGILWDLSKIDTYALPSAVESGDLSAEESKEFLTQKASTRLGVASKKKA